MIGFIDLSSFIFVLEVGEKVNKEDYYKAVALATSIFTLSNMQTVKSFCIATSVNLFIKLPYSKPQHVRLAHPKPLDLG